MKKKKAHSLLLNILLLAAIAVMLFSAVQLVRELLPEWKLNKEQKELQSMAETEEKKQKLLQPDWEQLAKINPDIIAWLYVEGSDISYPIVQGEDNSYYLDHSFYKEENPYGTIFLDAQAANDFSDFNSILYGHSISGTLSDMVFSTISEFEEEAYFQQHSTLYLLTPKQNYKGTIIAFTKTTDESSLYLHGRMHTKEQKAYLQTLQKEALYFREEGLPDKQETLLMLSTCNTDYGVGSKYRLLLHASLTKWNKDILLP